MSSTAASLHIPPALQGYTWRFAVREDLPAVHRMLLAGNEADGRPGVSSLAELVSEFEDPWIHPETDFLLAVDAAGEIAAAARVYAPPEPHGDECVAWMEGAVHPVYRGRGLGEFVFTWMQARARARLAALDGDLPRRMRTGCIEGQSDREALFTRHDFRPRRYFCRMRRDLQQPIPEPALPAALTLAPYAPAFDEGMRATANEAFQGMFGFEPSDAEAWQKFYVGQPGFRPDLTTIVLQGDEVAGTVLCVVDAERNAHEGYAEGWIKTLAVRRPWRKHGLATAMIYAAMQNFKAAGLEYAALHVDATNPTGAFGLYEQLGFVTVRRFVTYSKDAN